MEDRLKVSFDQIIPFSKARANLSSLINMVKSKDYVIIAKKYQPEAALINLKFLEKLLRAWKEWERYEAFKVVDEVRAKNLDKTEKEVERDVAEAIAAVRAGWRPKDD